MPNTFNEKILKRIYLQKRGWVFCPKDFLDITSRNTVDQTLFRLVIDKTIMKIGRGVYYFPIMEKGVGFLPADINSIARAVANNFGFAFFPSGEASLYKLRLSAKVPSPNIFWTNSKSTTKRVGSHTLYFKHAKVNPMANTPLNVLVVLSALNYLGKSYINDATIDKCAGYLSNSDKPYLFQMTSRVPAWVAKFIPKILEIN